MDNMRMDEQKPINFITLNKFGTKVHCNIQTVSE